MKQGGLCGRCEKRPRRRGGRYCRPCHAAYQRQYRRRRQAEMQRLRDIVADREEQDENEELAMVLLAEKYATDDDD